MEEQLKSLLHLWTTLAEEIASICDTSVARDIQTVTRRVEREGDSFLTITLPTLAKAFERGLERGYVDSGSFPGFRTGRMSLLPLFLEGLTSQVFNSETGVMLDAPSVEAIAGFRQLTMIYGKLERECTDDRVEAAFAQYIETDLMVRDWNFSRRDAGHPDRVAFREMARFLFADIFTILDRLIHDQDIVGRHGPGATADRLTGNSKWAVSEWHSRLENIFPYGEHLLPNWRYNHQLEHVTMREPKDERPVRVVQVPKTLKTPRIIAIEPTCMQYAQQAILDPLVELLESDNLRAYGFSENHIAGMIGFRDQEPNRLMARLGSRTGELATLDLSEASDRVSLTHVKDLLDRERWPHLTEAILASRSFRAEVPGHGVFPLAKYASMGSALCFPIEAMVFLTITMVGMRASSSAKTLPALLREVRQRTRIYGDDIVIPVSAVNSVLGALPRYGIKVNTNKSFWNGKFRESCGGDYFDGEWVTPVRFRRDLPENRTQSSLVISAVAFRNQLYKAGYWKTTKAVDLVLENILGRFPTVHETSPILGRHTFLPLDFGSMRVSKATQTPVVRGYVVVNRSPVSIAGGVGSLRKCLQPNRFEPFEDSKHLERAGRSEDVCINLRWRAPF